MLGSVVEVPSQHMNKTIYLDQQLYIPGMQYYVLMDKDTSSIAASFCNILQYNGAVQLVGEPLRHNALKYGETVDARFGISGLYLYVSTVEFDEYARHRHSICRTGLPFGTGCHARQIAGNH